MCPWSLDRFYSRAQLERLSQRVGTADRGIVLVLGTGASLVAPDADVLVYADLTRWEIQQRQRRGAIGNLGDGNGVHRPESCTSVPTSSTGEQPTGSG